MREVKKIIILALFILPAPVFAISINEIMYDLEGADSKREWVEIHNDGSENVDLTGWKFNDGSNHGLNEPPKNGGKGSLIISPNQYVILTGNAETFFSEHSSYSGTVIDTVMSLGNTSETLSLLNTDGIEVDSVAYTSELGANGDGNSLQLVDGSWKASTPTLGGVNSFSNPEPEDNSEPVVENIEEPVTTGSLSFPTKQQIFADAGGDRSVIVGADTIFTGVGYGLEGDVLKNAGFFWNFGDGTGKEGKSIFHTYSYPGEYLVTLDISSSKYAASDRIVVSVREAQVSISFADNDRIELSNNSDFEIDISMWRLQSGGKFFIFPKNTIILKKHKSIFPSSVTGLFVTDPNNVILHYPNGEVVVSYKEDVEEENPIKSVSIVKEPIVTYTKPVKVNTPPIPSIVEEIEQIENIAAPIQVKEKSSSNGLYKWLLALVGVISVGAVVAISQEKEEGVGK